VCGLLVRARSERDSGASGQKAEGPVLRVSTKILQEMPAIRTHKGKRREPLKDRDAEHATEVRVCTRGSQCER